MKNSQSLLLIALLFTLTANSQISKKHNISRMSVKQPSWSGAFEAPENVSSKTIIPSPDEPGKRIIISGTVYLPDGRTPAKNVIVYVYHTNNQGIYPKTGNEKGHGKFHGYLRGWMKTDDNGYYEFETIRPGPYQTHAGEPAHIHYTIKAPNYPEYWLTGLWFSDDPRVASYVDKIERTGGFSNITKLTKDSKNDLRGKRDILLQKF